jgi:hypothetical protein
MSLIFVRVAWMVRDRAEAQRIVELGLTRMYLSRGDAARCFRLAVEADSKGFQVVYAVGPGGLDSFDMEPARRILGFQPKDEWPAGAEFE